MRIDAIRPSIGHETSGGAHSMNAGSLRESLFIGLDPKSPTNRQTDAIDREHVGDEEL